MKNSRLKILRWGVQALFFYLAPFLFSAAFFGAKYAFSKVGSRELVELISPVTILLLLLATVLVIGRFFCGYVCAFGSFGDFIYQIAKYIRKKLRKREFKLAEGYHKKMIYIKYIVLLAFILISYFGLQKYTQGKSPWETFSMLIAFRFKWNGYQIGWTLLLLIVFGMAMIERFFCIYLCPLGAIFTLTPQFSLFRLEKERSSCGSCRACSFACPAKIKLYEVDYVYDGECLSCSKCVDVCPRSHMSYHFFGKRVNIFFVVGLNSVAIIALLLVFDIISF